MKGKRIRSLTLRLELPMRGIGLGGGAPLLAAFVLFFPGCGADSPTGPSAEIPGLPRALSLQETALVEAGNDFAFRLLHELYEAAPDSNLFIAPLSASMALGMTLNGAGGDTYDQMRETLGLGTLSLDEVNQGYRDLIDLLLELDPKVEMGIGNSIWYREGYPVRADFLERVETSFDAYVRELNFSEPGAAGIINRWVNDETRGKIKEIVESPINPATVMFLINATFFKAKWRNRFDKGKTVNVPFFPESGGSATVPLMELSDTLFYTETGAYRAVDLPYGGAAFSMTVVLPKAGTSIRELVAFMDPEAWEDLTKMLLAKEGTVYLPRFRMEWEKVLNETLQAMGMVDAFIPGVADFSRLSDLALQRGLFVSKVKQKSYVEVDEEGTEAAGVTVVELRESAVPDRFTFRADRPFLFVLRERFSGTLLFAGVYVTPPPTG
jgi:serpin B